MDDDDTTPDGESEGAPVERPSREALARGLRSRVHRIAVSLLRHAADADDATQVALLEIDRAAPQFRGESSVEAWADRIAVRTAIRMARQRRLAQVRRDDSVEPDSLHALLPRNGSDGLDELPRPLLVYLDQLPEARRTVLVLRHAMGYSIEEIGILTGTPVNTVKDRLLQAREQIRKLVRRDTANGPRKGGEE